MTVEPELIVAAASLAACVLALSSRPAIAVPGVLLLGMAAHWLMW